MNKIKPQSLEDLARKDGRYGSEVFEFVRQGLAFTVNRLHNGAVANPGEQRHITGRELSLGLRDYAIKRYGVMARAVLNHWNVHHTSDFGRVVFAMVENSLLQKTPRDNIHDFDDVYDFDQAFEPPPRPPVSPMAVFDWRRDFR